MSAIIGRTCEGCHGTGGCTPIHRHGYWHPHCWRRATPEKRERVRLRLADDERARRGQRERAGECHCGHIRADHMLYRSDEPDVAGVPSSCVRCDCPGFERTATGANSSSSTEGGAL